MTEQEQGEQPAKEDTGWTNRTSDLSKIYKRILTMLELARHKGTLPAERERALAMVHRLKILYNLSDDQIKDAQTQKEEDKFHSATIFFDKNYPTMWFFAFMSTICNQCDTVLYFMRAPNADINDPRQVHSANIVGRAIDVIHATAALEHIIGQVETMQDSLFDAALRIAKREDKQRDIKQHLQEQVATVVATNRSETLGNSTTFFFTTTMFMPSNFDDFANNIRRIYKETIPERESDLWAELEQDWGNGLNQRLIEQYNSDLRKETEEAMRSMPIDRTNALTISGSMLTVQEKKLKKQKDIQNEVNKMQGEAVPEQKVHTAEPKHAFMHRHGYKQGAEVDVKSVKTKGKKQ